MRPNTPLLPYQKKSDLYKVDSRGLHPTSQLRLFTLVRLSITTGTRGKGKLDDKYRPTPDRPIQPPGRRSASNYTLHLARTIISASRPWRLLPAISVTSSQETPALPLISTEMSGNTGTVCTRSDIPTGH